MSCVYIYIHTEENVCVCGLWVLLRAFVCTYVCMYVYTYIYIWGLELCRLGTGQYTVLIDIQAGIVIKSYIYSPLYIYTDIKYIRLYI